MKKVKALFALLLFAASVAFAGLQPISTSFEPAYVVQKGDTLWQLADVKLSNPWAWKAIVGQNPMLAQKGRVFEKDGKTIVLIKPGEKLYGLEKYGILPMPVATQPTSGTLTHAFLRDQPSEDDWSWLLWLIAIAAGVALAAYLINRMLNKPAATAGPAMVQGGVNDATVADQFRATAARQHEACTGTSAPMQQFTFVTPPVAGRISGIMNVRYADGREVPRRMNGERAYRARVRFPDGREEELYMLAACGNDLRYGGVNRYLPGWDFTFTTDRELPAPAAPEVPAAAPTPVAPEVGPLRDGVAFEYKPAADGRPPMARFRGNHQVDVATDGTVTLRLAT